MSDSSQPPGHRAADWQQRLQRGRDAYARKAWRDAHRWFCLADATAPLPIEDIERLAMSAYLVGQDDDYLQALERAHQVSRDAGDSLRAARAAFWLGLRLTFRGEAGRAGGWFQRAERLLQLERRPCAEEGYLLLPAAEQQLRAGDPAGAYATASRAAEIGDRFADIDLGACARHVQGRALLSQGQIETGLALLDEAMLAVTGGELSPIMTGLVYCSVIEACQQIQAVDRAREWTDALAAWCAEQPQLVSFTATCLVHRAEIMQLSGDWRGAMAEARRAGAALAEEVQRQVPPAAYYQQAEVHRLRGEFKEAEEAYRQASRCGCEPQPGLSLLRLAQGRVGTAAAAIGRTMATTDDGPERAKVLPAYVEIMLAAGDLVAARGAAEELKERAEAFDTAVMRAMAAQAVGAVQLAEGDGRAALLSLRTAFQLWQGVGAPYQTARVRELMSLACQSLGDREAAELERDAARIVFAQLGATPDLARMDSPQQVPSPAFNAGLTARELQVLRLVAAGKSNKSIASELCLSTRTIDRHVSNIFTKLDVPSRAAAAAWAYEHNIV